MAKSNKKPLPVIRPTSPSMMEWLRSQSLTDDTADAVTKEPVQSIPEQGANQVNQPATASETGEEDSVQQSSSQADTQEQEAGKQETVPPKDLPLEKPAATISRKPKAKAGEGSKPGSYPEKFFKKPAKSDGDLPAGNLTQIRISEKSHWLLSVLASEARRQGYKLSINEFLDNLLEEHLEINKSEVDELINQWKSRKQF